MLRHSLMVTAIGIAAGIAGAAGIGGYLEGMLFGITALDGVTFVAVALLFASVATVAAWIPARRAVRIDPLTALRYE